MRFERQKAKLGFLLFFFLSFYFFFELVFDVVLLIQNLFFLSSGRKKKKVKIKKTNIEFLNLKENKNRKIMRLYYIIIIQYICK
jgi:hypothetical protein